jgi:hypothetical protein
MAEAASLPAFLASTQLIVPHDSVTSDDDDNMSDISESGIDLEKVATQDEKEEAGRIKGEANKAFVGEQVFILPPFRSGGGWRINQRAALLTTIM